MTTPHPAPVLDVTGGSAGLAATYHAVLALATSYDTAGNQMRGWAALGARTMANGDLVESAALSPLSFAEAEAAVLGATTGPEGILVDAVGWETDAILIRVTIRVLEDTDRLVHDSFEVLDYLGARAVGTGLGACAPLLVLGALSIGPPAALVYGSLPPALRQQVRDDGSRTLEDLLTEHPEALQHVVNGGGGLIDGLWDGLTPLTPGGPGGRPLFTPDTESAAGLLAGLYDDGTAEVSATDLSVPGSGTQPGSVTDVITHLGEVAALSGTPDSPLNGTIEVQTITGADGEVRHIVYLPGTDDLTTLPWTQDGDVRDMGTNVLLVNGADNAYQDGILGAMHDAGIRPDEPVLLAGHSMGGMEAAAILSQGSDYDITNIVTAGSPTAQVDGFPPGSHVLSLEQHGDVVPLLDGEDNPDSSQQVTVQFDSGSHGITGNHGFGAYADGAAAVDASQHPSVLENVQSLHDHGFLGGSPPASVTGQVFQITRHP